MKCKVAILPKINEPFVIEECELSDPTPTQVRLKVKTCTICHSDIHSIKGEHGAFEGSGTVGHEIAGIVDAVGSKVTYVKPGDRVIACIVRAGCGTCEQCMKDRPWFCTTLPPSEFRKPSAYTRKNGEVPIQTGATATGFAEYTNCEENCLVKLDPEIPYEVGSALACGFISGFGAVINRCKVKAGESVLIVGCGGVGLSAVQGARLCGAYPIVALDLVDSKLELAKKVGATHTFNPQKCDAAAEVKKLLGFGADHTIVAVAGKNIKRQAISMTAPYGQVCFIGHGTREQEMLHDVSAMELLTGMRLTGSVMGVVTLRRDLPYYMQLYKAGLIDIDCMLTNRYPLERINEAFDNAEHGGALKNVVVIDPEP